MNEFQTKRTRASELVLSLVVLALSSGVARADERPEAWDPTTSRFVSGRFFLDRYSS